MPNEISTYRRRAATAIPAASVVSAAMSLYNRNPAAFNQAAAQAGQLIRSGAKAISRRMNRSNNSPMEIVERSVPAAVGHRLIKGEPNMRQASGKGMPKTVTISNREVISLSIAGSSSWTSQLEFDLNPGLSSSFPWLSNVAEQYQEYKFTKLVFHYIPIVPTSTQGDIIITPFYDAAQAYPQTEIQASDTMNTVIGSVWMEHKCVLSNSLMHPSGVKKYIRTFRMSGDSKSYDVGRIQVSTVNETGTSNIGKLYVEYTVQLFGPRLAPLITSPTSSSCWTLYSSFSFTGAATTFCSGQFNPVTSGADALGITCASNGTFSLPDGNYRVDFNCTIADTNSESNTITPFIYDVIQTRYWYGPPVSRPSGTYQIGGFATGQIWSIFNNSAATASTTPSCILGIIFNGTSGSFVQNTNSLAVFGTYVIFTLL
jgi:hypothetical protein